MNTPGETSVNPWARVRAKAADYVQLTKPRISVMALVTTLAGMYMAAHTRLSPALIFNTAVGVALVGGGANALNMALEHRPDANMRRTQNRPLPSGRMRPAEAWAFGGIISVLGALLLAFGANPLAAAVAASSVALYVLIYTPLKRVSTVNTAVGAIPGALPPLIGWAAASGSLPPQAWTLFAILFFWQLPHFFAIAWLYREDYMAGGFRMVASDDPSGEMIGPRMIGQTLLLILASFAPFVWRLAGVSYLIGAVLLGVFFLYYGIELTRRRDKPSARRALMASIIYLPALMALMAIDKVSS